MTRTSRLALLPVLIAAFALAGCGGLDTDEAEKEIGDGVKKQQNVENVDIDCPSDVELKKNDTFNCKVTGDAEGNVSVRQTSDDGDIVYTFAPAGAIDEEGRPQEESP